MSCCVQCQVCLAKAWISYAPYLSTSSMLHRLKSTEVRSSWTDRMHIRSIEFCTTASNFISSAQFQKEKWLNKVRNGTCLALCQLLPLPMIVDCVICQIWSICYFEDYSNADWYPEMRDHRTKLGSVHNSYSCVNWLNVLCCCLL